MSTKNRRFKNIMLFVFSLLFLVSILNIGTVFAGEKIFKLESATIFEKSDGVEATISSFDNDDVNADVVFHKLDDYVIFKLTLKNTTNKKYTIKSVKDNDKSNEVNFEYDSYAGEDFSKKGTIDFYIKEIYKNEANIKTRVQGEGVKLSFVMVDENGNVVSDDLIINPKTGDSLLFYIVVGVLSLLCIVLIAVRNKRIKMLMMISLLVLPIITYAALPSFVVKLNCNSKLFDKILIEKTVNGETVQELVEYNTPIEKPEDPVKDGYDFDNWYVNGHVYSFDTPLTEDTELVAHFTPKTYSIDYDLDGGSENSNPTTYTVETSTFTLSYPTKQGYVFSGWTGSNGSNIEKNVTISKGTTGNKSYVAHYNPSTNTPYKVYHKKQDLGSTTYTLADTDNLTGTTGSNVSPDLKTYQGFNKPEKQTKEIKADGSTEFEYLYTRKNFSFEVSNKTYLDVDNSTVDGSYPYETEITVKAVDRQGYTFEKWSNDMQGQTLTFKLSGDTSIYPIYVERGDTPYKVIHKKQNVTCDDYVVVETEELTGKTNATIHPAVRSYTGFTSPDVTTTTINADGSTEVIYEYDRISYTLNVTDRTYVSSTTTANGSYPYETPIVLSAVDREGYTFSKWSNNNTNQTLQFNISSDVTIYPIYAPRTDTPYKVYHKTQDYNSENYTLVYTDELTGTTGTNVTPAVKSIDGFTAPSTQTKEIKADGSTEIEYLYTRKSFTFEVSDKTYLDTDNSTVDGSYLYETEITVKAVDRPGYDFTKWSNNNTNQTATFTLTGNTSIYPIYTPRTNTAYTVYHMWKDLTGDGYTTHETQNLTGTTDTNVTPAVKNYTGFTSPSTQTKAIEGDGSTEFEYKYDRISYTLNVTDRTYVTGVSTANGNYPYETPITLSAVDRDGYDFTKWSNDNTNQTLEFNISEDVEIYPIYTAKTNTPYTVYHKWQDLTGDGYTTHETQNLTGTTDTNVTPDVKNYTGFTSPSTQTKKINGDGSTEFEYKYNRINYTFEVSDKTYLDTANSTSDGSYRYGTSITVKAVDRSGYDFVKWSNDETDNPCTFELTGNTSIYPVYTPKGDIPYTIYHKKQSLDLSEYVTFETEELTGSTGVEVTPAVKNYTGFTSPSTQTKAIEGDGSTEFEYKYDRISYTLNVTDRTYVTGVSTANGSYPYETPITLSAVDRPGYDFTKWSNNNTNQTLQFNISEDVEIYPIYTAKTNTAYTVYHMKEKVDGSGYETFETQNLTGTTDTNVTPAVREYTGFTSPSTQTKKINGDGSTEFEYKYDRIEYTFEVGDKTYLDTENSTADGTYKYGTEITVKALSRTGYTFTKWSDDETENPHTFELTGNTTISPVYAPNTNTAYTVYHKWQDLTGDGYTTHETQNLTGTSDTNVTPAVKEYTGFTSPSTQTKKINADGSTEFEYKYDRITYTLNVTDRTYVSGASTANGSYRYGTQIILSAVDRAGYDFTKWSNDETSQTLQFTISSDISIYPIYTAKTNISYTVDHYKMNIDGENYTYVETDNLTGTTDTNVTPAVKNYDHFTAPATQTKKINGDGSTTFRYDYERNQYTLNATRTYLTASSTANGTYYYETPITLSAVDRAGYNFVKWSNDETSQTIQFNISENVTIHPIYEEVTEGYTVTLNANGGNVSPSSITVTAGEEIGDIPTPTNDDASQSFVGWFTDSTGGTEVDSSFVPTGDIEIFAHWTTEAPIICKKVMLDELTSETCNSASLGCGKAGYNGQTITYGSVAYDTTLSAGNAYDCIVSVDNNVETVIRFYYIRTIDDKAVFIANTNFNDTDNPNNTYFVYNESIPKLPTTTQWNNIPTSFELSAGGNTYTRASRLITYDDLREMTGENDLSTEGILDPYTFLFENSKYTGVYDRSTQWLLEDNSGRHRYRNDTRTIASLSSSDANSSKNCTRPVIEIPLNQIETTAVRTVTLNPNGGNFSGSTDNILKTVVSGQEVGNLTTPTRSAHSFAGWYTGVNSGLQVDEQYIVNSDVTLYARWTKNPAYVISFDTDEGEPLESIDVEQGEEIGDLPVAEKDGYMFEGWYLESEHVNKVDETYVPTGNITLYANYTELDSSYVAIRDKQYPFTTLAAAIADAPSGKASTIKLLQDVNEAVEIGSSYNIKLDLNGHSMTRSTLNSNKGLVTNNGGTVEIKNGSLIYNGGTSSVHNVRNNSGTMIIRNVTMASSGGSGAIDNENGAHMTIIDSSETMTGAKQAVYNNGGTMIIKGNSSFSSTATSRATIHNLANGTLTIESGSITSGAFAAVYNENGSLTIGKEDGKIASSPVIVGERNNSKSYAIVIKSGTSIKIYDGIFKGRTNLFGITTAGENDPTINTVVNTGSDIETYLADIEDDSEVVDGTEEINNVTFKTFTLTFGEKWVISLNASGGTVSPLSLKVDKGSSISGLPTPNYGSNIFEGWYDENDQLIEDGYTPSSDMTLHAVWDIVNNDQIVEFRTTNDAMKVYYQNIDTWKNSSSNFPTWSSSNNSNTGWALDATENTAMKVNFDNNNCQCADGQCTSSGTVACDKPKGYDTGVADISVYLSSEENKEKGAAVTYAKIVNGVIYNLIPGQVYRWESNSDSNVYGYVKITGERRILDTGDVRNTRDLGGLPVDTDGNGTIDGHLAYGRLFRGIRLPSTSSVTELTRLGINSELDLRESNSDTNKISRYNRIEAQNYYVNPLNYATNPNSTTAQEKTYYEWTRAAVKYAMEEIVANKNLYFHCRIGTDRTGTVAWVLEGLLGVPEEDRIQDYELSFFYGLVRIHRYHNEKPGSSVGTGKERFVYMHNFMPTNTKIYEWYMYGTDDADADNDLIDAFRNAMIISN